MKKLLALVAAGTFALSTSAFAASLDLPEPTKEKCSDAQFMTDLATQMSKLTDAKEIQKGTEFIQKCHSILTGAK